MSEEIARREVILIHALTSNQEWSKDIDKLPGNHKPFIHQILETWLQDGYMQQFIQTHPFQERLWFNKEAFEEFLWWIFALAVLQICAENGFSDWHRKNQSIKPVEREEDELPSENDVLEAGSLPLEIQRRIASCFKVIRAIQIAEESSGYQVERLLQLFSR